MTVSNVGRAEPSQPAGDVRLLVENLAKALVDDPSLVSVEAQDMGGGTELQLRVAGPEIGKVIGKQGRTARALRTILAAVSVKQQKRYTLEIVE